MLQLKPMTPRCILQYRRPAASRALLMSVISGSRTVLLRADKGSIVAFDGPFHNMIAYTKQQSFNTSQKRIKKASESQS